MKLTKLNLIFSVAFLIIVLPILIYYLATYIKLFTDGAQIDISPQAAIEEYLSNETHEYKIINVTLTEEKFRARTYTLECDCHFKNEEYQGPQKYNVQLIDDLAWMVTDIEMIKNESQHSRSV
ncbi:hypothetical protein MKY59_07510 [Paenibacillus sp. FSL W8-0426]|uniref:hypothetical protein n=1 Tax=Paenibacillus sp. FSL W8-0426 TaxID=2921714 RepID=UPI0030DD2FB0